MRGNNMRVQEPETPAEMEALRKRPEMMEVLLHQRSEQSQRWALINNLMFQGRHDEARRVASLPEQQGHIDLHEAAIENPDDEWCGCTHEATALQPLKHQVTERSWSEKHGGMVTHYRCQYCGHRNATATPPSDGHDKVALMRKEQEAEVVKGRRPAIADGEIAARLARHPDE